jgi:hypothetical protein
VEAGTDHGDDPDKNDVKSSCSFCPPMHPNDTINSIYYRLFSEFIKYWLLKFSTKHLKRNKKTSNIHQDEN